MNPPCSRKRGRPEKPPVVCVKCGKVRKHKAKGMCFSCFQNQPKYSYRKEKYKRKKQMEITSQSRETPNNQTPNNETERRVTRSQSTVPPAQADMSNHDSASDPPAALAAVPAVPEAKDDRKEDIGDKPPVGASILPLNGQALVQ